MREPRFEVVRSDAGWFARFVAANGAKVWQTEVYTRRKPAHVAVRLIAQAVDTGLNAGGLGVSEVDERTTP